MPRGVSKSIQERISSIQSEIDELTTRRDLIQSKIDDLEGKKKTLFEQEETEQLKEIQCIISQSGKSITDILQYLKVESEV